jgi:hypothetical protein
MADDAALVLDPSLAVAVTLCVLSLSFGVVNVHEPELFVVVVPNRVVPS